MRSLLAAFDNADGVVEALSYLPGSIFEGLLDRRGYPRLSAYSASISEVERIKAAFPRIKICQAERFLDNHEGGIRGAVLGVFAGFGLVQLAGLALFYFARVSPVELIEEGSKLELSSVEAFVGLFLGFLGGLIGGFFGFTLGRRWMGLPPEVVQAYEAKLERGDAILVVNYRGLLPASQKPLGNLEKASAAPHSFSLERFQYWLGEFGATSTRLAKGKVIALNPFSTDSDNALVGSSVPRNRQAGDHRRNIK
ncbi:MAG TPA: hypothetical protein VH186_38405 [Chloroflexia bacterium]|nr:hypothetical protein [Chloroflexia bacterium]